MATLSATPRFGVVGLTTSISLFATFCFPLFVWKTYARTSSFSSVLQSLADVLRVKLTISRDKESDSPVISAEELRKALDSAHPPLVVDCRPLEEYFTGHIKGAVQLPFSEFRAKVDSVLGNVSKDHPIVVTCFLGHYSPVGVKLLKSKGYKNVSDLAQGMEHWQKLKYPIVHGVVLDASSNEKNKQVYMDNQATTRLDPRVLGAMLPFLQEKFGNAASSSHSFGSEAALAVVQARMQLGNAIGAADPVQEIRFTSGATESNNLAIKGIWEASRHHTPNKNHIITCATEHKAVLDTCRYLEKECGALVTYLPVREQDGRVDLQQLEQAMTPNTLLVSIMAVNNEIGVIHPFRDIGKLCRDRGVWFHTDGTQAVGKVPIHVQEDCIDLLSMSGHKMYGPKGVGALYIHPNVHVSCQIHGGGHELGSRAGTLNVPSIVGMGLASKLAVEEREEEHTRLLRLRNYFLEQLAQHLTPEEEFHVNGSLEHRIPGNVHVSFVGIRSQALLMELYDIALSAGSACTSKSKAPSHVLKALNLPEKYMDCPVRVGMGRFTTEEEVHYCAQRIVQTVKQLRKQC